MSPASAKQRQSRGGQQEPGARFGPPSLTPPGSPRLSAPLPSSVGDSPALWAVDRNGGSCCRPWKVPVIPSYREGLEAEGWRQGCLGWVEEWESQECLQWKLQVEADTASVSR